MNILRVVTGNASGVMPVAHTADPKELLLLRDLLKDLPSSSQPRKVRGNTPPLHLASASTSSHVAHLGLCPASALGAHLGLHPLRVDCTAQTLAMNEL